MSSPYSDSLDASSAPAWKPEVDDRIIGAVTDVDEFDGGQYDPAPVLTISVTDPSSTLEGEPLAIGEEYRVFGFSAVLRNEIEKTQPQVGDVVGVKYIGLAEKRKAGQSPAKLFKFKVFERGAYGQAMEEGRKAALAGTPTPTPEAVVQAEPVPDAEAEAAARLAAAEAELARLRAAQPTPQVPTTAPSPAETAAQQVPVTNEAPF
jgi:hypothetical protein